MIIAGEASGDLHGAELMNELRKIDANIDVIGIGGDKMIKSGLKKLYHINDMAFLGFVEVIRHLPFIKKVKKNLIAFALQEKVKTVVLIDYPGFNLSIAKSFKSLGIKNIYYISPQIWAWGKGRITKIKKLISRMIVFFPFEKDLYSSKNIKADFVGHPLIIKINQFKFLEKNELFKKYNLNSDQEILLLLPGSRKQELEKIFSNIISAADRLSKELNMQTIVACAENVNEDFFSAYKSKYKFSIVKGDTYNLIKRSKFAIVKSGTSTLETGIIGTPFLVVYKTNFLTYLIGKSLVKIKNIALANIVAEKSIVKELIQSFVNPDTVYEESKKVITNEKSYIELKNELGLIKNKLKTEGNPSKKAAQIIYAELNAV